MSDSVPYIPNIFEIFKEYGDLGPKTLSDVPELEAKCRAQGKDELADQLFEWRVALQFRLEAELTEPSPIEEQRGYKWVRYSDDGFEEVF